MIVLLEGPDGCGKTTLAESISTEAARRGMKVILTHEGKPPENENLFKYYMDRVTMDGLFDDDAVQIMDRHHVGHMVYGTTRHKLALTWRDVVWINDTIFAADGGGKIIFMVPPRAQMLRRLEERSEDWPRILDEHDRFEFMGELLQNEVGDAKVRVDRRWQDQNTKWELTNWALKKENGLWTSDT